MKVREYIIAIILLLVALVTIDILARRERDARDEADHYKQNVASLLTDIERYKTADSLNVARVRALSLTVEEFERLRAADAATIRSLKLKNRELSEVATALTEQNYELAARPVDTVILRDSVEYRMKTVHCGDAWYDFQGVYDDNEFRGRLAARDSILIVETIQRKRFLGFLWKTNRIKNWQIDVTNRNPHSILQGYEHIILED